MEIRFFKRSESQLLRNAIHSIWSPNHVLSRNESLLNYMFYDNPAKDIYTDKENYSFLGAWVDGQIVGLLGVLPFYFNTKGVRAYGCSLTNWIVLAEHRRTAAGIALFEKVQEQKPDFLLSLGINENVAKLYQKMQWPVLQNVPRWVGLVNKKDTIDKLLNGNDKPLRHWKEIEQSNVQMGYIISDHIDATKWDEFYWNSFATKTIGFVRDYSFIKWRYLEHIGFDYKVLSCEDTNGNYKGLIVYRIETINANNDKIGRILEFIAVDQDSAITLANMLVGIQESLLFWDFYCFSSVSSWGLESIGFKKMIYSDVDQIVVPTRFQPLDLKVTNMMASFYVSKEVVKKINLTEEAYWYITKGDSDQDRPN